MIISANGFKGIDRRGEFTNDPSIASDMRNFRITDSGSLVKRNGFKWLWNAPDRVNAIWSGNINGEEMVIVAAGGKLYRIWTGYIPSSGMPLGNIGKGECSIFQFDGILYIKTSTTYHKYDGTSLTEVEGYIPLIAMSCAPDGSGVAFEEINLLTTKRRQAFSATGTAMVFQLAERDIDEIISVKQDGRDVTVNMVVDTEKGVVNFTAAPPAGTNNIEIIYSKKSETDLRSRILACNRMMLFGGNSDGRVFLWGNDEFPNYRFHSDLANGIPSAEYFPANGFTIIGNSKINCILQQYDKQLIFTENSAYYSYCELKTDSMGRVYSSFPVFSLNNGKGCIIETQGCVIDNSPVTLCPDGFNMWESTSVVNEKNATPFSSPIQDTIRSILKNKPQRLNFFDFQPNRELFIIIDDEAYIYNYGNGCWYAYDDFGIDCQSVLGDLLYCAKKDVMYVYGNDLDADLERVAYWESCFMNGGSKNGVCDLIRLEADMHIKGRTNLRFEFLRSGSDIISARELSFEDNTDKFTRISIRPYLRRTLPFSIRFTDNGGRCVLHGFNIKTRQKERSNRNGLL